VPFDPWPLIDKVFAEPKKHLPADLSDGLGKTIRDKWVHLPEEHRSLLKLLSRFEITRDQAKTLYVLFIAIIWINHHYLVRFVGQPTLGLIWINFAHLFLFLCCPLRQHG
jgi:hypothetical protein